MYSRETNNFLNYLFIILLVFPLPTDKYHIDKHHSEIIVNGNYCNKLVMHHLLKVHLYVVFLYYYAKILDLGKWIGFRMDVSSRMVASHCQAFISLDLSYQISLDSMYIV